MASRTAPLQVSCETAPKAQRPPQAQTIKAMGKIKRIPCFEYKNDFKNKTRPFPPRLISGQRFSIISVFAPEGKKEFFCRRFFLNPR